MDFTVSSFLEDGIDLLLSSRALNCRLQTPGRFFLQSSYVATPCLNVTFGAGIPPSSIEEQAAWKNFVRLTSRICDSRYVQVVSFTRSIRECKRICHFVNWRVALRECAGSGFQANSDIRVSFTRKHVFNWFLLIGAQLLTLQ